MIEFSKIIIDGFCSIKSLELSLNNTGIVIIRGANGFGKTNIFAALVWCLYGKNIKGNSNVNTWKKFRPKDYKGTKVELYFKPHDGKTHKIIRCLNYTGEVEGAKGGNRLIYLIDAEPVDNKTKTQIQSLIEKDLEMSYNLFINSVMFGQGLKRLIQESGSDKKQIFEEIFDLGYLTKAKKIAQDKYNQISSEVRNIQDKVDTYKGNIEDIKSNIEDINNSSRDFKKSIELKIIKLKEQKTLSTKRAKELELKIDAKAISQIESSIKKKKLKVTEYRQRLKESKTNTGISLREFIDKLIVLLEDGDTNKPLKLIKDMKSDFIAIEKYNHRISTISNSLEELSDKLDTLTSYRDELNEVKQNIETLDQRIKDVDKVAPNFDKMLSKNKSNLSINKERYKKSLDSLEVKKKDQDLYKWAYSDPFGNNGIKAFLFESSLGYLNEVLGTYSEILGFHIQFTVDLQSARKDFETIISMDGVNVSYDELSGGQKQLCNLAMAFAMNQVMTQSKGINIAFLDEVFESLSSDNIEIVIGLIRKVYKDKSLFLITHHDSLPIPNAKTMIVKRNKGLSYYEA